MLDISLNPQSPFLWRGLRVGLLGGSFNPPHAGHLLISQVALQRLKLDAVWWLVSPGNPLKDPHQYAPLNKRLAACREWLRHEPRMVATTIETQLGTTRSYDSIKAMQSRFRATEFVFLMGADSAQNFHHWYRWHDIPDLVSLAVMGRPPVQDYLRHSPLKRAPLQHVHLSRGAAVPLYPRTCYWVGCHHLSPLSSTLLRKMS